MKILQRHIGVTIIMTTLFVLLVLIGLQIFIAFINELGDIGVGNYGLWQALQYIILTLPNNIYSFFPMAGLLGSLIGLGYLASNRELVVMRTSGFSILQIIYAILGAAIILLIIATFIGEVLGPQANKLAELKKEYAKTNVQVSTTMHGLWIKKNNDFIYIQDILSNKLDQQTWNINANLNLLSSSYIDPATISIAKLDKIIHFRKSNGLTIQQYSFVFWQRVLQPFATLVMIFLAIPFIFGPLRSVTMGLRILTGISVGFSFYLLNQIIGSISLVYQIPPFLSAICPSIFFLGIGSLLMHRLK
jgi:lipopolysaccharide export system permease protein